MAIGMCASRSNFLRCQDRRIVSPALPSAEKLAAEIPQILVTCNPPPLLTPPSLHLRLSPHNSDPSPTLEDVLEEVHHIQSS